MTERATLAPRQTRALRAKLDLEWLWLQPQFRRFLFTVLDDAPMFASTYGTQDHLHYAEGRRSLGLQVLRDVGQATGLSHTAVMAKILADEDVTQKETPGVNRRNYDRHSELDPDRRERDRSAGRDGDDQLAGQILDYGSAVGDDG